ncbi:hypothetical protein [Altererythrobacter aquiaggeris]|uniref:hypothetical protein n=1 Tax=Aestuarierythrobacter aquiaggeris TaxID=1898396 RepID=UPI003018227C
MAFHSRMFSRLVALPILVILALFAANRVNPQITGEIGENIDVGIKAPDMSFFSAEDINLKINSIDDVFAAGGRVRVDATRADHLVIAGSEISVSNAALQDLFAVGGKMDLNSGTVADDIVVAGGSIKVRPTFSIGGSAVMAGGDVRMETSVPADLRIGAGSVYVNAAVGGDARLSGDAVRLGPATRIAGDLLYRTSNLVIEPGAVITGRRLILPAQDQSAFESWGRGAGELFPVITLAAAAGFAILVVAIAFAVPGLMRSSARFIRTSPLRSLGIGTIIAAGVPVAIILLFFTVVGAPLGLLLGAICLAVTPVAIAATAFLIGMEMRRVMSGAGEPPARLPARLLWPAAGAAVILILGLIPFLGMLVWLLAMLLGLGAVASRGGKALASIA